jgi:hypothetical protein
MAVINFWLDAALFLTLVFIMWVSVLLQFIFPAPSSAAGWLLWGWSYDQWHTAQFIALCVFALLAVEHLVLHWTWVCSIIAARIVRAKDRPDEGQQAVYGVGTFIVVLVTVMSSLLIALLTIKPPPV